jgi:hypothetical protein
LVVRQRKSFSIELRDIFSVIKRLINLLSDVAREMGDSEAARKQAEAARRQLERRSSNDPTVGFDFL